MGRDALRGDGRIRRGMGFASQYWWGGGGPPAYAEVRVGQGRAAGGDRGLQDLGTGTMTACAIIAAERLGVPVETSACTPATPRWSGTAPSPAAR